MATRPPPLAPRARGTFPALAAVSLVLAGAACSASQHPKDQPRPDGSGWVSPRFRNHPLVGKVWRPSEGKFATEAELTAAVVRARFALLGETHDNADHHILQARLVRAIGAAGRSPALAFEMLDVDRQADVDASLARAPRDALALSTAVRWSESGWPPFGFYRPVFEAGLAAGMPIVAANLPRKDARALFSKGPSALPEPVRVRLEKAGPFPDDVLKALREEMAASHCGELPESMVEPMVTAQKAKDAQLADRLVASDRGQGAILIAGSGHLRTDVAVPMFLRADADAEQIVAVAMVEVSDDARRPEDYAEHWGAKALPFDWVLFTPAAEREDPCAKFREEHKKTMAAHEKKGTAATGATPAPPAAPAAPAPAAK